jgi:hypothetical protein
MDSIVKYSEEITNFGFAGFCGILLWIIVWLVHRLLNIMEENNRIIGENTKVIQDMLISSKDQFEIMIQIKDKLLSRPCIADKE